MFFHDSLEFLVNMISPRCLGSTLFGIQADGGTSMVVSPRFKYHTAFVIMQIVVSNHWNALVLFVLHTMVARC